MTRVRNSLEKKRARAGYVFCLPFIAGFIFFFLTPLVRSAFYSFSEIKATSIKFVGIANYYNALLVDPNYVKSVFNSLGNLGFNFILILLFSFFIANLLNQRFRGRTLARAIFFLPVIVTSGVIIIMQNDLLMNASRSTLDAFGTGGSNTQVNKILMNTMWNLNIHFSLMNYVTSAVSKIYDIVTASGVQILIFLAGLQTISPSLYEASAIEGASAWENLWKITLPMISPMILVNAVYTVVDSLGGLSNPIISTLYDTAFKKIQFGYSAAMGWIYFIIIFVCLAVVITVISPLVYYENK